MRLIQSFHLPERKIWRCAASWPRNAVWVNRIARNAAVNSCHQVPPIQTKTATDAAKAIGTAASLVQ